MKTSFTEYFASNQSLVRRVLCRTTFLCCPFLSTSNRSRRRHNIEPNEIDRRKDKPETKRWPEKTKHWKMFIFKIRKQTLTWKIKHRKMYIFNLKKKMFTWNIEKQKRPLSLNSKPNVRLKKKFKKFFYKPNVCLKS